jgi:AhpD family alkylhydroperoxidase
VESGAFILPDAEAIAGSVSMSSPATFYETWPSEMNAAKARAPEVAKAFGPFFREIMKDGALPNKQKELIALAISVALRCEHCIYAHAEKCFKAGATGPEVMEAAGVAVMMQGGPGYTYLPLVARAVEHLESRAATQS